MKTYQTMFWSRNLTSYSALFFSNQLDQQLALHKNLLELSHSYVDTQSNWTCPWLYRKPLFMKTHQIFLELEIWQPVKYFFLRPARSTIRSLWEPTKTMTLLRRPSVQLNNSLTELKTTFCENAPEDFLSSKSDNLLTTFFSVQLDQQLALHENLLGLWHSYLDPWFNWTSLWLYWKPLFVKTHQNIFWARNLTTYWVLFSQTR